MNIVAVGPSDDAVLAGHYLAIWDSYGTPAGDYVANAHERVLEFIEECRQDGVHGGFLAIVDGEIAGSSMCCLLREPYPKVILPSKRLRGYIWSVYTTPAHRRKGIGRALTATAVEHLRRAGCTSVVLHASDAGMPMYEAMGFRRGGELKIDLTQR